MTDEKTIYVSPEDDVTTVRERLEKTSNRQVTLIIPAQTQLRSLVAWRVLHADARKMGKDVLIISTDPQIRSLAQAGKFRVAHSQAASITSKSRPPSRPGRTGNTGKGRVAPSSQARTPSTRKIADQRGASANGGTSGARSSGALPHRSDEFDSWYEPVPQPSTTQQATEDSFDDITTTGDLSENYSSQLDPSEQRYGQILDLHSDTAPSIRNLPPQIDEDPTYLAEDYKQAQDIRQSAQRSDTATSLPSASSASPQTPRETTLSEDQRQAYSQEYGDEYAPVYRTTPLPTEPDDVYQAMEENIPPSPLAEQHGSATVGGLDTSEHPIHDVFEEPTETMNGDIEDLGDFDDSAKPFGGSTATSPTHSWSEPTPDEEQPDNAGPPRLYKSISQRSNRRDNRENVPPFATRQDVEDPDYLPPPPIEDRPTVVIPPEDFTHVQTPQEASAVPPRGGTRANTNDPASIEPVPTGTRPTSRRASQQTLAGTRNPAAARQRTQTPRTTTNAGTRRTNAGASAGRATVARKMQMPFKRSSGLFIPIAALLLFLLLALVAFIVPAADVTLALPSKDYAHAMTLKAVVPGQQTNGVDVVPGDKLSNDFIATGTGKATSSSRVGTAPATGNVTFTNSGNALVTLPTGTIVAASNGTIFTTQAEAVVDVNGSNVGNTVQVPVQAQKSGDSGNVGAGAISNIPLDSKNTIAQYNKVSATDLKLTVVNEAATMGGGVGTTPAVSQQDIDALKASMRPTLNSQYNAWLGKNVASGDQSGSLTTAETLVNAPSAGQTVGGDGTFTEKLKLSVTVLVIRAATLQRASTAQLNEFLKKDKANASYTVVSDSKHLIRVEQPKTTSDGKTVSLAFNAVGRILPNISVQKVQGMIDGKSVRDAHTILMGISGVQRADISTSPTIGSWSPSWIPFWTGHINVHLVPQDDTTPSKK